MSQMKGWCGVLGGDGSLTLLVFWDEVSERAYLCVFISAYLLFCVHKACDVVLKGTPGY